VFLRCVLTLFSAYNFILVGSGRVYNVSDYVTLVSDLREVYKVWFFSIFL